MTTNHNTMLSLSIRTEVDENHNSVGRRNHTAFDLRMNQSQQPSQQQQPQQRCSTTSQFHRDKYQQQRSIGMMGTPSKKNRKFWVYHRRCCFCHNNNDNNNNIHNLPSIRMIRRTYHCILQTLIGFVILIALLHNVHLGRYSNRFYDSLDKSAATSTSLEYRALLRSPNNNTLTYPPSSSSSSSSIRNETDAINDMVWWNNEDTVHQQHIMDIVHQHHQMKSSQRKERCRPPSMNLSSLQQLQLSASTKIKPTNNATIQPIHIPITTQAYNEWNWTDLCQKANLNQNSRVLITNSIVTSSIGPALALLISQQCHVISITSVDPILPNIHSLRIHAMYLYRILYRSIPHFKLIVPMASAGLATIHAPETRATLHWLDNLSPTHIIHLDPMQISTKKYTAPSYDVWKPYLTTSAYRMYQIQNSILSMQQILQYSYQTYHQKNHTVQLLHVVDTTTTSIPAAAIANNGTNDFKYESVVVPVLVNVTRRIQYSLSDFYHSETNGLIAFHRLNLPYHNIYGSLNHTNNVDPSQPPSISTMEDAIAAILMAIQHHYHSPKLHEYEVQTASHQQSQDDQYYKINSTTMAHAQPISAMIFDPRHQYSGRGDMTSPLWSNILSSSHQAEHFQSLYNIHLSSFPCASSCRNTLAPIHCTNSTVLDRTLSVSRAHTGRTKCKFVVYMVDYDINLRQLYQTPSIGRSKKICRLAFVSSQSIVVHETLNEKVPHWTDNSTGTAVSALETWNGKLLSNGWTLIWGVPVHPHNKNHWTASMSVAEYAMIRLEPSQLFTSTVQKTMYVENADIARAADITLVRILEQIDRPALPTHWIQERRSGIDVMSRYVERPATAARSVAMFMSEPSKASIPKSYEEYVQRIKHTSSIPDLSFTLTPALFRRLKYYRDVKMYVMQDRYRPDIETSNRISTMYPTFPWQWISMDVLVHDVQMESARQLRCAWYDEYLYWTDSSEGDPDYSDSTTIVLDVMEELSFAYLVGIQRLKGLIGPNEKSWIPLYEMKWNSDSSSTVSPQPKPLHDDDGSEVFLRFMKHAL